ncbi:centrosomal protein of 120 kDa-like [Ctenocephalides felis]|uniref:centrosomal protein of 120 kDa-like n=1 Tax=Ctenocephalides felis TaxID=7515 RepID=UPI000E6E5708|nr:centrosomal protein of 120 kDa-like [Ctenocephalides felis]
MVDSSNNSLLQIVLHIEDGNGFTFIDQTAKVYFVATLNGISLDSVPVEAGKPTEFNTELVWEVKRKDLRELKLSNKSIKVEFFSIKKEEHIKLGYLMVCLKSAPSVLPGTSEIYKKSWSKLLGVSSTNRVFPTRNIMASFY